MMDDKSCTLQHQVNLSLRVDLPRPSHLHSRCLHHTSTALAHTGGWRTGNGLLSTCLQLQIQGNVS